MHHSKDVVGEAGGVGVMLFDPQVGFVIEQAVQHVGGVPHADVDDLGVKGRVLVGNVGVKLDAGFAAVFGIDVAHGVRARS